MTESLHIVGSCDERVFGLWPAQRLERQSRKANGALLVASASAVLGDCAIDWLRSNPGKVLTSPSGKPLAIVIPPSDRAAAEVAISGGQSAFEHVRSGDGDAFFNRKLRKRETLFGLSVEETPPSRVQAELFDNVYKGVTDLVTKWVWPAPAYLITRMLAAYRVPPNAVTIASIALVFAASYFFLQANLWLGLAAAWLMTFFDTVDGKLARVTCTSSKLGDRLDHGTDLLHPPLWWVCLALGLMEGSSRLEPFILPSCGVILGCYVIGRLIEVGFKLTLGFNQYIWRPFDSYFRLIVARRNSILLIMTVGTAAGAPEAAFAGTAAWSVISVIVQLARFGQGYRARPISSWLTNP